MDEVTLATLRSRAQIYANQKGVQDSEWNLHINDAVKQYWNIVNTVLPDYNLTSSSFTTESGTALYSMESDVLLVRKVSCHLDNDTSLNSTSRFSLRTVTMTEIDRYANATINAYGAWSARNLGYRVWDGNNILLVPTPQQELTIVYYYLPVPPTLSSDSDTVNGIAGLDVYISAVAAKAVLDSRRISNIYLDQKIQGFVEFMKQVANTHDGDEAQRIEDAVNKNPNTFWW